MLVLIKNSLLIRIQSFDAHAPPLTLIAQLKKQANKKISLLNAKR